VEGLGISPSKQYVDYVPNLEYVKTFTITTSLDDNIEMYAKGAFSEFVIFDKKEFMGTNDVKITLVLPDNVETPGENVLIIGAREKSLGSATIAAVTAVQIPIVVRVPYPGKYVEIELSVNDVNIGEEALFNVQAINRGKEAIHSNVDITLNDLDGNEIEKLNLGSRSMEPLETFNFKYVLNTSKYEPADYNAVALVDYGGFLVSDEKIFRIGNLLVNIVNYSSIIVKDGIRPYFIDIESRWNYPIEGVFAEVYVSNEEKELISFLTPSARISSWEKSRITGYLDTSKLEVGKYDSKIVLSYGNETIIHGELEIINSVENNYFYYLIFGVISLIVIFILIVFRKGLKLK